MKVKKWF